ncbi:hypothetical protein GCM10011577_13530 [Pseudarthrobacter polychromogenes]|uniref:Uncharacterized protein n=1 Tax=Pseudarthrobacter polychromogenes TaxID=1676 RepID=A0ABQ1XED1_9MICC|nr:hypothetical protein GCM10011577_13530 [Pseudarthrobacter polychromogenes]
MADPPQHFKPVDVRKADIQRDNIGLFAADHFHAGTSVHRCMHFESRLGQHSLKEVADIGIVFNYYSHTKFIH